jgi:lipopolysaccharide export system permease protein
VTLLRGYIMWSLFRGVATALAVLVAVFACVEFVGQVNDVGTGDYGFPQALTYVLVGLGGLLLVWVGGGGVLGWVVWVGLVGVERELVVMRASGISSMQLLGAVGLAGFGLAVLMALLGESLAPSLSAYAAEMRTRALAQVDDDSAKGQATWLWDGDRILSLRRQAGDIGYGGGVLLFEVGPDQTLKQVARADAADIDEQNRWVLSNYSETSFLPNGVDTRSLREAAQTYTLANQNLLISVVREDMLDTPTLRRYIRYLKTNQLDSRRYEIAYWTRLSSIASVVIMTVLALPFVFGGLRSAGTGARLLVGLVIGLSYYVIGETLARGGEVYDLDPLVVAWTPSAILLVVTLVALSRAR